MKVIKADNLWESYRIKFIEGRKIIWEDVWALQGVSFDVSQGDVLGVIGQNGAGKTTLLRILSGMLEPDRGNVDIKGKVSSLMELVAGFNPELTGRENIIINAKLYGISTQDIDERVKEIIDFARIGRFIDAPLKYYSQGMYVRLGFGMAVFVEPDVLLIDDILSVGDKGSQERCIDKILSLKDDKKTIVVVSHDMDMVKKLCNRVILLEKGSKVYEGSPDKAIFRYVQIYGDAGGRAELFLDSNKIRVVFSNGRIFVSYNDDPLTKGSSIFCVFSYPGKDTEINSFMFSWKIEEVSSSYILARGVYAKKKLEALFKVSTDSGGLNLEVYSEGAVKRINLLFDARYNSWIGLDEEGVFPEFSHKFEWDVIKELKEQKIVVLRPESSCLPFVVLENDVSQNIYVSNTGYEEEARAVSSVAFENIKTRISFLKEFNKVKLFLDSKKEDEERKRRSLWQRIVSSRTLTSGSLRLYLDVENKKISLFYQDKELTKSFGFHVSFLYEDMWYGNQNSIIDYSRDKDNLLVKLSFKELGVYCLYKFTLSGNTVLFKASFFNVKGISLERLKFGIFVSSDYKEFFAGRQRSKFPQEFTFWQDIPLDDNSAGRFGLLAEAGIPALIFNNPRIENTFLLIQNSDKNSSLRALQINFLPKAGIKDAGLSASLEVFKDNNKILSYIKQQQEALAREQERIRKRLIESRTLTSGSLRLYLDVENKKISLFYQDKELTKSFGFYFSIYAKRGYWLRTFDGDWRLERPAGNIIVIKIDFPSSFLSAQEVTIKSGKDGFYFQSLFISKEKIEIIQRFVAEFDTRQISQWFLSEEKGRFSSDYINESIAPVRISRDYSSNVGFINHEGKKIVLEVDKEASSASLVSLYCRRNRNVEVNVGEISIIKPLLLDSNKLIKGTEFSIKEGGEGRIIKKHPGDTVVLQNKDLLVNVSRGVGFIRCKGKTITGKVGLYSSIRKDNVWYDSHRSYQVIKNKSSDKVLLELYSPYIDLSQRWVLRVEGNIIFWDADIYNYKREFLEIVQFCLGLSSEYTGWEADKLKGYFSDEYPQYYDILPFRYWYGKPNQEGILVRAKDLPLLAFKNIFVVKDTRGVIENSDSFLKSRIIAYQYTAKKEDKIRFSGKVEFYA